jgi:hypothetical protein
MCIQIRNIGRCYLKIICKYFVFGGKIRDTKIFAKTWVETKLFAKILTKTKTILGPKVFCKNFHKTITFAKTILGPTIFCENFGENKNFSKASIFAK